MPKNRGKEITDDELLNQCIKENKECRHVGCSKSVTVVKIQCHLCKENFCTSHMLPEVHGCGEAIKKEASARPKPPPPKEEKAAELENKMTKKLQQMQNNRKKKAK